MRKGQTALEYLMTYGWAIIVVIIVVGALYALGLTKPCRWTGTQIREFGDFKVGEVKFDGGTKDLSFTLAYLKPEIVESAIISTNVDGGDCNEVTVNNVGVEGTDITIHCPNFNKPSGDCYTARVKIVYNITGGRVYNLVSYGTISGIVA